MRPTLAKRLPPVSRENKCGKRGFPTRWAALSAMMKVPIKPTGQQPLVVYRCGICVEDRWHFSSKPRFNNNSQPRRKGKNRGRRS